MIKKVIILLGILFFVNVSVAQIQVWKKPKKNKAIETVQWQVNDIVYKVKKEVKDPFSKNAFAIVKSNNTEQKIPLFYNGDKTWVFRYSSASIGNKTFVIASEIKELDGEKGKIVVAENKKENRHGGVVLSKEDTQHFYYEDGSHYFNLAFECDWLFALDYNQKEIPKTEHLLSLIEKYGFNQVVMNVYSYDVKWPKAKRLKDFPEHEYGSREDIFPFLGSNSKPDFTALNVDFFKHFDRVISQMHDKEIVSHLMIYVWNKLVSWPDMETKADNMYYDYVVKRYQGFPNIIWDVSKEALHYTRATKEYISERIKRTRKLDSYNRLVSVHDYGFCRNHKDEVDFISTQDWKHTLYQNMLKARNDFPNKPIFNIEHGGYEDSPYVVFPGAYDNAEACLRRNYMCLFAGAYSTYYWQGASWNAVIHNPFEQPENFKKPHFEYFKHMRTLFKDLHFENFKPMPNYNNAGYNLTNEKDGVILVYNPKENNWAGGTSKALKEKFNHKNATKQWFNTITGEFTKEVKYVKKPLEFWDARPWKGEADTILILRNLQPKKK
ncbi:DUF4038 domain-containing protein [Polaribacter sp. Z014]|uniref:apiosidase-like domain-containing protein n=1 Tax=Polaribacter sp. Z014 TaxID=2927126 RepID=UPI002022022E|nr:DUF4038 domain-containing protein [Polaribacter sp. Z014]MCL7764539.1 DUF4038 domain-containing protein [Polaribacter sp. Z014]